MENDDEKGVVCGEEWFAIPPDLGEEASTGHLSEPRARLWALVLESRSLPCQIEHNDTGMRLLVPVECHEAALNELRLFEEENRGWPPPEPPATPLAENVLATFSVLILLATFHNITQLDITLTNHQPIDWTLLGNAHAEKILSGEWWRLVT